MLACRAPRSLASCSASARPVLTPAPYANRTASSRATSCSDPNTSSANRLVNCSGGAPRSIRSRLSQSRGRAPLSAQLISPITFATRSCAAISAWAASRPSQDASSSSLGSPPSSSTPPSVSRPPSRTAPTPSPTFVPRHARSAAPALAGRSIAGGRGAAPGAMPAPGAPRRAQLAPAPRSSRE